MIKAKKNIVVFASGSGSNTENIIRYFFNKNSCINVCAVFCNRPQAGVLQIAENHNIDKIVFSKENFENIVAEKLTQYKPDLIVLAGFLLKMPASIVKKFPNKIINIHPALLPKFGGKGMYGMHVHKAVIAAKEKTGGITIHYVNERYDEGKIIFQKACSIHADDTPETLQKKIQELEHIYYPQTIEKLLCHE